METITIKIEGKENLPFFLNLLRKLNFVCEFELKDEELGHTLTVNDAPIEWAVKTPDINDFTDIWSGRNITLEELRNRAWKRK